MRALGDVVAGEHAWKRLYDAAEDKVGQEMDLIVMNKHG